MADFKEREEQQQQERKIPVFTVEKNGAILKNIFILNSPVSPSSSVYDSRSNQEEIEEIVIVGRHPDCNIVLTHPSISRLHVQINCKPYSQKFSVTDMGSVHGTWISGNKIEPGVTVDMAEGDTLKVGCSTRIHRLQWVPLSWAYDMESPFVISDASMASMAEIKEEETMAEAHQETALSNEFGHIEEIVPLAKLQEEASQGVLFEREYIVEDSQVNEGKDDFQFVPGCDSQSIEESNEIQLLDLFLENICFLFSDDKYGLAVMEENPLAPLEHENMPLSPPEHENMKAVICDREVRETQPVISLSQVTEVISENKQVNMSPPPPVPYFQLQSERSNEKDLVEDQSLIQFTKVNSPRLAAEMLEGDQTQSITGKYYLPIPTESVNLSNPVSEPPEITDYNKESESPPSLFISPGQAKIQNSKSSAVKSEKRSALGSISSRRDQPSSASLIQTDKTGNMIRGDDVSVGVEEVSGENIENRSKAKPLSACFEETENEVYTPDKENTLMSKPLSACFEETENEVYTPDKENTLMSKSLSSCFEETENDVYTPDKENTLTSLQKSSSKLKNSESRKFSPLRVVSPLSIKILGREQTFDEDDPEKENFSPNSLLLKSKKKSKIGETENDVFTPDKENTLMPLQKSSSKLGELKSSESRRFSPLRVVPPLSIKILGREKKIEQEEDPNSLLLKSKKKSKLRETENDVYTPDQENALKSVQKSSSKLGELKNSDSRKFSPLRVVAPLSIKILGREQTFEEEDDPEKENFSPNSLLLKSKKKSKLGETKNLKSSRLSFSNVTFSPGFQPEESTMASSDKENQSLKPTLDNRVNLEQQSMVIKGRTNERAPFQSLLDNSASKRRSEGLVSAATQTENLVDRTEYMEKKIINPYNNNPIKKNWTMVVDTASLLDKESRKSLQHLQGLKGTRIVFPRTVIRELDRLKRQGSFFRRREASAVLDWIEECMVKTNWWIHVQSSPTPPVTPQAQFSEETHWIWSLSEIATPTAEDHILECALLFRTMKKENGQLVLLSNDVTLKIKAMSEGLLCETAEEFRESLINPFSERFLWTDSSPRGRTWSHLDDVVLREKYNHFPSRKSLKEGAKGLRLILLHNSQYGQKSSIR